MSLPSDPRPAVLALMGPTASGKTQLAVRLAQTLGGEVISVDSALVYRGMDIGTAKPTPEEREGIPHHLIDILDPSEIYSTGQFRTEALALMQDINRRGRIPILAGGTMLYFNALSSGLSDLPAAHAGIRQQIDREASLHGWEHMHEQLGKIDPEAAQRIHPNDPQRIQRALEVYRITGLPLTQLIEANRPPPLPFRLCKVILSPESRDALHHRIRIRFGEMLRQGLIDEVRGLMNRGDLHADLPAIRAVGYRQVWCHLNGDYDEHELAERAVIATRQFAKRQMTWLRRETDALNFTTGEVDLVTRVETAFRCFSAEQCQ